MKIVVRCGGRAPRRKTGARLRGQHSQTLRARTRNCAVPILLDTLRGNAKSCFNLTAFFCLLSTDSSPEFSSLHTFTEFQRSTPSVILYNLPLFNSHCNATCPSPLCCVEHWNNDDRRRAYVLKNALRKRYDVTRKCELALLLLSFFCTPACNYSFISSARPTRVFIWQPCMLAKHPSTKMTQSRPSSFFHRVLFSPSFLTNFPSSPSFL
jgi:hypothetical protein